MFDDLSNLSKEIRMRKKNKLKPDMDYAGQDAMDPNEAWDAQQDAQVNETLGEPDHEPASKEEMGENESSQNKHDLKRVQARINSYFNELFMSAK